MWAFLLMRRSGGNPCGKGVSEISKVFSPDLLAPYTTSRPVGGVKTPSLLASCL